jgi:hypothetical protein
MLASLALSMGGTYAKILEAVGRVTITLALVALAPATTVGAALLYCTPIPLNEIAVKVLDGGSSIAVGPTGTVSVSILASDPFFVCWASSGRHLGAATFAVIAMVIAIVVGPLALYYRVRRDSWLRVRLAKNRLSCSARALMCCQDEQHIDLDDEELLASAEDPSILLAPIVTDFRPVTWYTKFIDIALTIVLSCVNALLQRPTTLLLILAKAGIIVFATLAIALFVVIMRPYRADRAWMGLVRAMLLVITACCACMNAVASAIDIGQLTRGPRLSAGLLAASVLLVVFLCGALVLLVVGVGHAMITHASAEREAVIESRRRWTAHASAREVTTLPLSIWQSSGGRSPNPSSSPLQRPRAPPAGSQAGRRNGRQRGGGSERFMMQDNPHLLERPRDRASRSRRVLTGPESSALVIENPDLPLRSVRSAIRASATLDTVSTRNTVVSGIPDMIGGVQNAAAHVLDEKTSRASQTMRGADSATFVLENPLFPVDTERKVGVPGRAVVRPRQAGRNATAPHRGKKGASATVSTPLMQPFQLVDTDLPMCHGCVSSACVLCNSDATTRFQSAVLDLSVAVENLRPKTALARCRIIVQALQDGRALPRLAITTALTPVSDLLWVFPKEPGVVAATCLAMSLIIDRLSDASSTAARPLVVESSSRSLESVECCSDDASASPCAEVRSFAQTQTSSKTRRFDDAGGSSSALSEDGGEGVAQVLTRMLRNLPAAFECERGIAQCAAIALAATCAAVCEHLRVDYSQGSVSGRSHLAVESFVTANTAKALVATICAMRARTGSSAVKLAIPASDKSVHAMKQVSSVPERVPSTYCASSSLLPVLRCCPAGTRGSCISDAQC